MFYVFHTTDITDGTFGLFTFKDRNFLFPRFQYFLHSVHLAYGSRLKGLSQVV